MKLVWKNLKTTLMLRKLQQLNRGYLNKLVNQSNQTDYWLIPTSSSLKVLKTWSKLTCPVSFRLSKGYKLASNSKLLWRIFGRIKTLINGREISESGLNLKTTGTKAKLMRKAKLTVYTCKLTLVAVALSPMLTNKMCKANVWLSTTTSKPSATWKTTRFMAAELKTV